MHRLPHLRIPALVLGFAALAMSGASGEANGQDKFPSRTIEVISHASPGGGTDNTARMMMAGTSKALGADMVVTYQRGGGAKKALEYLAAQPADGHTIIAMTETHLYNIARGESPMKIDGIVGVARAMEDPTFIVVGKNSPYKTLEELIAASKEKPLNWGTAAIGGTEHIGLARFAEAAGMKYKVIPFGSGGEMVNALMANAIDATLPNVSEGKPQVEDGTFRALAVMNNERLDDFPDVPTTFEKDIPVRVVTTRGYGVKEGTPPEIVKKLEAAMLEGMRSETFVKYLRSSGLDPETSVAGSEVWDAQLEEELANATEALKMIGVIK